MSALPREPEDRIPDQDTTHGRIRSLLASVTGALLEEQPGLLSFHDHRPERDRSSGESWRGLQTLCHVSALLASDAAPDPRPGAAHALLRAVEARAVAAGMHRRAVEEGHGGITVSWRDDLGDLLEVVVGVRVAVRAISAPFLPGSLHPVTTTSPVTALSPLTPPPRRVR